MMSITVGILALLQAKPDRADALVAFDPFETRAGREAHLAGEIAKALTAAAPELLAKDPDIKIIDIVAVK